MVVVRRTSYPRLLAISCLALVLLACWAGSTVALAQEAEPTEQAMPEQPAPPEPSTEAPTEAPATEPVEQVEDEASESSDDQADESSDDGADESTDEEPAKAPPKRAPLYITLLPWVAIGLLFYYLLIRPQKQQQHRRKAMLAAVKKNDRVITAGGIYGVVTNVRAEADEVTVRVDETTNTKLRVTFSSVSRVLGDESSEDTSK